MLIDYKNEKFSGKILLAILIYIIFSSIYYLSFKDNLHKGIRIWELSSYIFTFLYTIWFWNFSDNGNKIFEDIGWKRAYKVFSPLFILLFLITAFHIYLFFWSSTIGEFISRYSINITLLLIIAAYSTFFLINNQLKKHSTNNKKLIKNLKNTFDYVDKPVLYVFCMLFVYSVYVNIAGYIQSMEMFFSGAIAFELLLSGYIWTRTDIA